MSHSRAPPSPIPDPAFGANDGHFKPAESRSLRLALVASF